MNVYLLNLKVNGIKSIEKEVELSFYNKRISKNFDPEDYRIKAIYGENGSGKTALITAIKIVQDMFLNTHYLMQENTQILLDELINKKMKKMCVELEILFRMKSNKIEVYKYEIVLSKNTLDSYIISYESLWHKNGNTPTNNYHEIYTVHGGEISKIKSEDYYTKLIKDKTTNLLKIQPLALEAWLLLIGGNGDLEKINSFQYHIINLMIFFLTTSIFLNEEDQHSYYSLIKKIKNNEVNLLNKEKGILNDFIDYYVTKNHYYVAKESFDKFQHKIKYMTRFISIFKKDLIDIEIEKREDKNYYDCELVFVYPDYRISLEFESTGIKRLTKLYECLNDADHEKIVFVDEIDTNINSIYLKKLIDYFIRYGKGQLCMTLHSLEPMEVLKENKLSIDFLTTNGIKTWIPHGNASPENFYRFGMVDGLPLNIDAEDFLGVFDSDEGESDE
jgi:AAA15 family ATPase/GTPase